MVGSVLISYTDRGGEDLYFGWLTNSSQLKREVRGAPLTLNFLLVSGTQISWWCLSMGVRANSN